MARNEKTVWNRFSGIYDIWMRSDKKAYKEMCQRITQLLPPDSTILEIATGTGIIALQLAHYFKQIEAIDFSPKMIANATKKALKQQISNVHFSVQDALSLSYETNSFDAVIFSNTLHIMPEPEKALLETRRVLKPTGLLIAPTFVHANSSKAAFLSRLMSFTGFKAYHKWTQESYHDFLEQNGFTIVQSDILQASFPMDFVVARH